jgi:two-component system phosphate regulon sensor histidine kinase PhoR
MQSEMETLTPTSLSSPQVAGWIVAVCLAAAWMGLAWMRRRQRAQLLAALQDESCTSEGDSATGLEPLARAAFRRVRAERERHLRLTDRLSEIERVVRATPIAVIALDHLQRVVSANPAAERLLGFDERAARGRLLQDFVRQPALNRAVSSALATAGDSHATGVSGELHLDFEEPLEVQFSCEPLHTDGQPPGLVLSLVDVTRLRRLESMRSEFAANVSHELRTPITNIKGYVETLLQVELDEPAQQRRFLEIIHRNTLRLSGIVEDILTLAFLEEPEARHTLERKSFCAREATTAVAEDLGSAANVRGMRLLIEGDTEAKIFANRPLVEQALANLISNAIKYSSENQPIRVVIATVGPNTRLSVIDRGPGIATKHVARIFERFYRIDKARTRTQGGTGLGLAIVKHIATIHGGRVEVESQIGEGSRFHLILPNHEVSMDGA